MTSTAPAPPLPGRGADLAALAAALKAAQAGTPAAVALVGEGGIGKSALLAALRDAGHAAGALVLAGRASEHERDVPFGATVDVFDEAVDALGPRRLETLGPDRIAALATVLPGVARQAPGTGDATATGAAPVDRFHVHRALRAVLELLATARPVVLVLDDLHWADPPTLELAVHLLRRPARGGHVLALGFRPTGAVDAVVDALLAAPHADERRLAPLDRDAALTVLAHVPDAGLRRRLEREAGGNPLFLRELARAAADGGDAVLPPTIVAAVQREARGVPPASRALLDGAAVAGDPFDPELAAVAAQIDAGDAPGLLDHLVEADLVRPADGPRRFRFRHPLVRRAIYDASPPGWRLGAHERAAAALAARGAPLAAQAYHVARCARPGDDGAIALLVAAADGTLRTAPAAAVRTYAAARALVPEADAATAAVLDHRRAMALAASGRVDEAVELSAQALERGALPPGVTTLQAAEELCGLEGVAGRIERARARVLAHLRDLPPGTPPADTAGLEYVAAMYAFPDADEALRHGHQALRALEGRRDLVVAGIHCAVALAAHAAGDPDAADRHQRDAAALLAAASDTETMRRLGALTTAALLGVAREQLAPTQELLARAAALAAASAQAHWTGPIGAERAGVLVEAGRPGDARAVAEEAEDVARAGGQRAVLAAVLGHQAVCDLLADRPLDARARIAEATAVARAVTRHPLTNGARASLVAAELDGDPERLRAALLSGPPVAAATSPTWRVWRLGALVAAELALGRVPEARGHLPEMAALADRHRLPAGRARALLAEARLRGAQDDPPAAAALAGRAAAGARAAGAVLEAHEAELVRGTALAAAGERDEAVRVLRALVADTEAAGLLRGRAAAARELRRLGDRPAAQSGRAAAAAALREGDVLTALTPREREIVALVGQGRSNKQVGAVLHLSEKTIENNLSRVYAKLGAASRSELVALVAARRAPAPA